MDTETDTTERRGSLEHNHTQSRHTEKVVQCKLTDTVQLKATESPKLEGENNLMD